MSMLCASRVFQARAAVPLPHPSSDWAAAITEMASSGRPGLRDWRRVAKSHIRLERPLSDPNLLSFADVRCARHR
ncbi:hypothetical protein J3F84DRAFT_391661 [Trichoderma pleuroticola]